MLSCFVLELRKGRHALLQCGGGLSACVSACVWDMQPVGCVEDPAYPHFALRCQVIGEFGASLLSIVEIQVAGGCVSHRELW